MMKAGNKLCLIAVLMAAVMFMTACPSFAESTTAVEFEDFTLATDEDITPVAKGQGTMFTIHPFRKSGDMATNINGLYLGNVKAADFPAAEYSEYMRSMENEYRKQYAEMGMSVTSFRVLDAVEARAWGRDAFLLDILIDAEYQGGTLDYHQRQIVVFGDFGCYGFTCTSTNEDIDETEKALYATLSWK
jgi:hypothetical protein